MSDVFQGDALPNESVSLPCFLDGNNDSDFPKEGVSLRYILEEFIPGCGGEDALQGLSTGQVCDRHTKEPTRSLKCSFCTMMRNKGHSAFRNQAATVFVSHAHSYLFLDVINALQHHFRDNLDIVLWFDLFSINQHLTNDWSFEWLSETFQTAIGEFGHVVMVMSPWNNPLPFTRAWCVFEAYCAVKTGSRFEIAMSDKDREIFLVDMKLAPEARMSQMLATIRAEDSKSFKEEDRKRIFHVIQQQVGFSKLNTMVFECYRTWVVDTALEALNNCTGEGDRIEVLGVLGDLYRGQGDLKRAEIYHQEYLEKTAKLYGEEDPRGNTAIGRMGILYANQGRLDQAEFFHLEFLAKCKVQYGDTSPSTLTAMHDLAMLYYHQGNFDKSEPLYLECIEKKKVYLGEYDASTLSTMNALVGLYSNHGHSDKAEPIAVEVVKKQKATLGANHPETLLSMGNLASIYYRQDRFDKAEPLMIDVLESRKVTLGPDHPFTLTALNNLAQLYKKQRCLDEAESLLSDCQENMKTALGVENPLTLQTMNNLAMVYQLLGRMDEAESLYHACLEKRSTLLGESHPDTIKTKNNLEGLYEEQGSLDKATELGN